MTRSRLLFFAYLSATLVTAVCYIAADWMWEACGFQYGAQPYPIYRVMTALTVPYMVLAFVLVVLPVFLLRLFPFPGAAWLIFPLMSFLPLALAVFGAWTMLRSRCDRRRLVLGGLHIANAALLFHMGFQMLMSV